MTDPFDPATFRQGLIEHGLLIPTGVKGGDGRSAKLEDILDRFDALVMRNAAGDGAEALLFPPIVARTLIERMGYLGTFPQLIGSIHSFFGNAIQALALAERARKGEDWSEHLQATGVTLNPAVCYPVYPGLAGTLPPTTPFIGELSSLPTQTPTTRSAAKPMNSASRWFCVVPVLP